MASMYPIQPPFQGLVSGPLAQSNPISIPPVLEIPFVPLRATLTSEMNACQSSDLNQRYYSQSKNSDFVQFLLSLIGEQAGSHLIGYSSDFRLPPPTVGSALITVDPYSFITQFSSQQVNQINWILRHGYPAVSATQLFTDADVSQTVPPPLTDGDAFAATQLAIWGVPFVSNDFSVQDCATNIPNAKSARIAQVANHLLTNARDLGSEWPSPPCICIHNASVNLSFQNCSQVLGPFTVLSDEPRQVALALDASVPFAAIVDASGVPIDTIATGASFFIRIPMSTCFATATFTVCASITGTYVIPLTFTALDENNRPTLTSQPLVAAWAIPGQPLAMDEVTQTLISCGCEDSAFIPCNTRVSTINSRAGFRGSASCIGNPNPFGYGAGGFGNGCCC